MASKKKINLSVSEFAIPSPLQGSIEALSGFGKQSAMGIEIHQAVQALRIKENEFYKPEVLISHSFERGPYIFQVSGRMDGFCSEPSPQIEEIKSSFNIHELGKKLYAEADTHPYCLQLRTYGYIYWLQNHKIPKLNFHLFSTRNSETYNMPIQLNLDSYEPWLERRLDELVDKVQKTEKNIKRRKKTSLALEFPFQKPREGQIELIQTIEDSIQEKRPLLIQAPTGLGKTMGVLYPSLKESLKRGQKTIYITPKNSQHSVAEDALERLQEMGAKVKSMTLTAKSKMCFKNEPLCNPDYCEYAKDHYTKLSQHNVLEELSKKRSLNAKTFRTLAGKYEVCPFEIQLDAAENVDSVICDYNYVFAPRSAFGRLANAGITNTQKPNLVIDEAHNLPFRAMDYYSPALSVGVLEKMREDLRLIPIHFCKEAEALLDTCISIIKDCAPPNALKASEIAPPIRPFMEQDEALKSFLSNYLKSDVEIAPKDPVLRLCFYWSEFTANLEFVNSGKKEFFTTYNPYPPTVKITCCDASQMLSENYKDYSQVVAFSATLKPFDFYSRLSGLHTDQLKTAEFTSPFPKENRKVLIIPQISSKYSERERNYSKIAEAIQKISRLKKGNYFAFFPSFEFMERVLSLIKTTDDVQILKQERFMQRDQIDFVLESLKDKSKAHLVFAVQGGVFSEGVDYPGDMIIGAFIVGPPLPHFDVEREKMKEYYQSLYSAGFDYAYTYPAMAKAVQAAGRVIRSETDKGIIILMDDRFINPSYVKSMPQDWFKSEARELVSKEILKDISSFWNS